MERNIGESEEETQGTGGGGSTLEPLRHDTELSLKDHDRTLGLNLSTNTNIHLYLIRPQKQSFYPSSSICLHQSTHGTPLWPAAELSVAEHNMDSPEHPENASVDEQKTQIFFT
jgi:hypothetical protein